MALVIQISAIVLLICIQVSSAQDGKYDCAEPRQVFRSFDMPESCANVNFTNECHSVDVIRACQDDHTKSCQISKSIVCGQLSRHEANTFCAPGETLLMNNTFFVCKTSGEPAKVSQPECSVHECDDFGKVANGTYVVELVRVAKYAYANRVRVQCNEGFVLHGWPMIDCTYNHTWAKAKPKCISVKCGSLPGQTSPCLQEINLDTSDDVIRADFTCLDGNDFNLSVSWVDRRPNISTNTSYCENTRGAWSWSHGLGCYCNCYVPGSSKVVASDLTNGSFLKHGKELSWDCVDGYRKKNNRTFKCEDSRLISIEYKSMESGDLDCSDTYMYDEFLQCVQDSSIESVIEKDKICEIPFAIIVLIVILSFISILLSVVVVIYYRKSNTKGYTVVDQEEDIEYSKSYRLKDFNKCS